MVDRHLRLHRRYSLFGSNASTDREIEVSFANAVVRQQRAQHRHERYARSSEAIIDALGLGRYSSRRPLRQEFVGTANASQMSFSFPELRQTAQLSQGRQDNGLDNARDWSMEDYMRPDNTSSQDLAPEAYDHVRTQHEVTRDRLRQFGLL